MRHAALGEVEHGDLAAAASRGAPIMVSIADQPARVPPATSTRSRSAGRRPRTSASWRSNAALRACQSLNIRAALPARPTACAAVRPGSPPTRWRSPRCGRTAHAGWPERVREAERHGQADGLRRARSARRSAGRPATAPPPAAAAAAEPAAGGLQRPVQPVLPRGAGRRSSRVDLLCLRRNRPSRLRAWIGVQQRVLPAEGRPGRRGLARRQGPAGRAARLPLPLPTAASSCWRHGHRRPPRRRHPGCRNAGGHGLAPGQQPPLRGGPLVFPAAAHGASSCWRPATAGRPGGVTRAWPGMRAGTAWHRGSSRRSGAGRSSSPAAAPRRHRHAGATARRPTPAAVPPARRRRARPWHRAHRRSVAFTSSGIAGRSAAAGEDERPARTALLPRCQAVPARIPGRPG